MVFDISKLISSQLNGSFLLLERMRIPNFEPLREEWPHQITRLIVVVVFG